MATTAYPSAVDHATDRTRSHSWADPAPLAQAAREMSGLEVLQAIAAGTLPPPPIVSTLGFDGVDAGAGWARFWLTPAEYHYNPAGAVHGGVSAAVLDTALACAVQSTLPAGVGVATVDLHVSYLRPMTAGTGRVRCEGRVIRVGSRIASAEGQITDAAGHIYAHATATLLLLRDGPDQRGAA